MRDLLVLLIVFSSIPMIFLRPHVGILAWCWISYMNPHRLAWGFAYEFPVAMVIGIATLAAIVLSKESKKLPMTPVSALLLAFVIWFSIANLFAMVPDLAFEKWKQSVKILLMTFVTMTLMNNRERVHALIWVIVASLAFFGVKGGVFTIVGGASSRVWGPPGTFIADNNALAMALIMVLPLVRYLQLQSESLLIRLGLYGVLVTMGFSIIGSHSRGAFLASGAMVAFLILKSRRRLLFGGLLLLLVAASAAFVPQKWIERMETIQNYEQDTSAMSRLEVWSFGLQIALERPLTGGGFRVSYDDKLYLEYVPDALKGRSKNFHSVYFEVLGETGFVGLFIYLGVLISAWRSGSRIISRTRDRPELSWANDLARMLQVSLVGFAVAGTFQNLAFFDLYFHLVAILFVTDLIVARSLKEESVPPTAESGRSPAASGVGSSGYAAGIPLAQRSRFDPFKGPKSAK